MKEEKRILSLLIGVLAILLIAGILITSTQSIGSQTKEFGLMYYTAHPPISEITPTVMVTMLKTLASANKPSQIFYLCDINGSFLMSVEEYIDIPSWMPSEPNLITPYSVFVYGKQKTITGYDETIYNVIYVEKIENPVVGEQSTDNCILC